MFGNLPEPPCLNVLLAVCSSETTRYLAELTLQPAFDVRPAYTYRPRLVSRVTFTRKPPFTLTYHIRRAARWSDGVPVTARDFEFTHRARVRSKAVLLESDREELTRMGRVSAVDRKTVRVVLRSRYSGWRGLFANVLPAHALEGQDDLTKIWRDQIDNPRTGRLIGSGPFLVGHWDRGEQLVLVRNRNYWGPHRAYLDRIVIRFRPRGETPVDWFRNGEVHVASSIVARDVPALRREPGVNVLAGPSAAYQSFAFRMDPPGHPALAQKLVRRAIAYAIDRAALVRAGPGEIDPKLPTLQSLLFLPQSPYYQPHWRSYSYRPAHADRLFEEAGCRKGPDGIHSCAGERLSLRFVTRGGNPGRARILELVQAQLRRSGVEVVPTYAGPGAFDMIISSGDFDVGLYGFESPPNPTGNAFFGCGGSANFTGYCTRLVTADLDQADRILDAGEQARVMNRADAQMAKDVPAIPLFQVPVPTAVRDTVKDFAQALNPLTNAENWWLER